jgi:AcrR family transcriptional regulator
MSRRAEILDGALGVLADHGMRGLTHRAVDTAAALPAGSTSYYFRSRAALVAGCVQRLLERDLEHDVPAAEAAVAGGAAGLVEALTGIGVSMATAERRRTLARYELSLAGVRDPDLRAELVRGGDVIRHRGAALLAGAGATDPVASAAEVAAVLDGLVYTALTRGPDDPAELGEWLRPTLDRLVRSLPGLAPPRS